MVLKIVLITLIRFYRRFLSPMLGQHCRFVPTCSCYAQLALERFGVLRGGWLAIKRLSRCHPFCKAGFDPLPETLNNKKELIH